MMNSVLSELLKLKRNRLLLILFIGLVVSPALTPLLMSTRSDALKNITWIMYLLQSQLPIYICTMAFTVIATSVVFAGEFQHGTINTLFASTASRASVIASKQIALLSILFVGVFVAGLVNIAIGAAVVSDRIGSRELAKYLYSILWSVPSYFALVPMACLLGVVLKKAALASILYFGFTIMVFPFYEQAVFIPPLLPMHLAMHVLSRGLELPAVAFLSTTLTFGGAAVSLSLFFGVPLIIEYLYVRRMDICS